MRYHRELRKEELSLYGHQTTHEVLNREREQIRDKLQKLNKRSKNSHNIESQSLERLEQIDKMMKGTTVLCEKIQAHLRVMDPGLGMRIENALSEVNNRMQDDLKGKQPSNHVGLFIVLTKL
jgi:hypothetical protein